jgi:hypothetical protein
VSASPGAPPPSGAVMQMVMVSRPGKERTEAEWRTRYERA